MHTLRGISKTLIEVTTGSMPTHVLNAAKLSLLHNLVAAGAGIPVHSPGEEIILVGAPAEQSETGVTVWKHGVRASSGSAVVFNSLTMGARAQHDEHPASVSHFGSVVVPALLAFAEQGGLTGALHRGGHQLLVSMIAGYQAGAALGSTCIKHTAGMGRRPTGMFGPFAGAAAVATALQLSEDQLAHALAFALSAASGTTQVWLDGSDEWRWQTAFAARSGYESAMLAAAGARGAAHAYEGASGFLRAIVGITDQPVRDDAAAQTVQAIRGPWAVKTLLLKPFPVCAINQAAVSRVTDLARNHPGLANDLDTIEVSMSSEDLRYPGVSSAGVPRTWAQAMMSLPYGVSAAAVYGNVRFDDLTPPANPRVSALMKSVQLVEAADALDGHSARVRIRLRDGAWIGDDSWTTIRPSIDAIDALASRLESEGGFDHNAYAEIRNAVLQLDQPDGLEQLLHTLRSTTRR